MNHTHVLHKSFPVKEVLFMGLTAIKTHPWTEDPLLEVNLSGMALDDLRFEVPAQVQLSTGQLLSLGAPLNVSLLLCMAVLDV